VGEELELDLTRERENERMKRKLIRSIYSMMKYKTAHQISEIKTDFEEKKIS
jgi:hypothetical protein